MPTSTGCGLGHVDSDPLRGPRWESGLGTRSTCPRCSSSWWFLSCCMRPWTQHRTSRGEGRGGGRACQAGPPPAPQLCTGTVRAFPVCGMGPEEDGLRAHCANRDSPLGQRFSAQCLLPGDMATSGTFWLAQWCALGIQWVEARGAANICTSQAGPPENSLAPQ